MVLIVTAFPYTAVDVSVIDDYSNIVIYDTQVWYDDIIPEVNSAKEKYDISKVLVCGPESYTAHIADNIREYNQIDVNVVTKGE